MAIGVQEESTVEWGRRVLCDCLNACLNNITGLILYLLPSLIINIDYTTVKIIYNESIKMCFIDNLFLIHYACVIWTNCQEIWYRVCKSAYKYALSSCVEFPRQMSGVLMCCLTLTGKRKRKVWIERGTGDHSYW